MDELVFLGLERRTLFLPLNKTDVLFNRIFSEMIEFELFLKMKNNEHRVFKKKDKKTERQFLDELVFLGFGKEDAFFNSKTKPMFFSSNFF